MLQSVLKTDISRAKQKHVAVYKDLGAYSNELIFGQPFCPLPATTYLLVQCFNTLYVTQVYMYALCCTQNFSMNDGGV